MLTNNISYGKQSIDDSDIDAVIETLKSDRLTQGSKVDEFEESLAKYCGAKYAVAVSSATAGLHLAYQVLGLSAHDEIITSPITFAATTNAALYLGAEVKFVDIVSRTVLMDNDKIEENISSKTKILVPVHFAGLASDMVEISRIATKHNLRVVEDAAHALGARYYNGKKVGCCDYSDMTVFSFHPVKSITTGEGGAITTNSKELYDKLKLLRSHGIVRDSADHKYKSSVPYYHEMQYLGYNYRMTDIQAALGISQLKRLDKFVKRRNLISNFYRINFLDNSKICALENLDGRYNAYHLFVMLLDDKEKRNKLISFLESKKISTQIHYMPVYKHPYYIDKGYNISLANAEDYYERCVSLPIYPAMEEFEAKLVTEYIKEFINLY